MAKGKWSIPGTQKIADFPQIGPDKSKRFSPAKHTGTTANTQRKVKPGIDPSSPDKSRRFNPPPA